MLLMIEIANLHANSGMFNQKMPDLKIVLSFFNWKNAITPRTLDCAINVGSNWRAKYVAQFEWREIGI